MPEHSDARRFLQAVFGNNADLAIFANLKPAIHTRALTGLDGTRDCYWSVGLFAAGELVRRLDRALGVVALVIDDVGTKVAEGPVMLALGRPTAVVETSLGNFQWTYRLSTPVAVAAWHGFAAAVTKLVGCQKIDELANAVALYRLPMGINTKKGKGGFAVRLVELNPDVELVVENRGIFHDALSGGHAGITGPGPSKASGHHQVRDIAGLLELIPNDDASYDEWIARAHQVKALALDEAEGWEAFDAWSRKSGKYDADETARRWATVEPSRTFGGELLRDAEAADREGYNKVMGREARGVFDDGEELPPPAKAKLGTVQFRRGKNKEILLTMDNAARALAGAGVVCRYDEFHHRFLVEQNGVVERFSDHLVLLLRVELNAAYGRDFGPVHIGDAIMALGLANGFNPVCEMLDGAEMLWDGVGRLDRLGPDYFHTDDTELARQCFRKVMIAAVRRARAPGCKFDQILVTESPEGWDKSSAWAVLAGDGNFSDADILGKSGREVQEELADIWIHEIADLSGLTRAEVEHVKAFASRTNDRARPVYGRVLLDQPRQSIEVGTTNADSYLMSSTGNRRFWTFRLLDRIDIGRLRGDRLALWGEAAAAESAGETLVLDQRLWGVAGVEQEKRRVIDTWEDELGNLAEMPAGMTAPSGSERIEVRNGEQFISNLSVAEYLSGYRRITLGSGSGRRISEIMRRLGWERCQVRINGTMMRGYTRAISTPASGTGTVSVAKKVF